VFVLGTHAEHVVPCGIEAGDSEVGVGDATCHGGPAAVHAFLDLQPEDEEEGTIRDGVLT